MHKGYAVPFALQEETTLRIVITDDESVYDATALGGLQIARYLQIYARTFPDWLNFLGQGQSLYCGGGTSTLPIMV